MMLHASGLGPSCCDMRDRSALGDKDKNKIGYILVNLKTEEGDDQDNTGLERNETVSMNNSVSAPSLFPTVAVNDGTQGDNNNKECCMELKRRKYRPHWRASTSPDQNRFVTLTVTNDSLKRCRMYMPLKYLQQNGFLDKPGMVILMEQYGTKIETNLLRETSGRMLLGKGWKKFAKANSLDEGVTFTLELIWEDETPVFSLFTKDSKGDKTARGGSGSKASQKVSGSKASKKVSGSKASEKVSVSTETISGNRNNIEGLVPILNRFVTLSLTPEDARACTLYLPIEFMRANDIEKPGKITLLGKDEMKWWGYLLTGDGTVAVGCGWRNFCEANGVKTGDSFSLEFLYKEDTTPVLKFGSTSGF